VGDGNGVRCDTQFWKGNQQTVLGSGLVGGDERNPMERIGCYDRLWCSRAISKRKPDKVSSNGAVVSPRQSG
jgi:hypothetical protein